MTIDLHSVIADGQILGRIGDDPKGIPLVAGIVAPGLAGVVGNGVADDRAAIQAIIDAAEVAADEGGTILFAPGVYQVGGVGLATSNVGMHLVGSGLGELTGTPAQGATVLRAKTSGTPLTGPLLTIGASQSSVSDMTIDGAETGDACLQVDGSVRSTFQRLHIRDSGAEAIRVGDLSGSHGNQFSNIFIAGGLGIGIYLAQYGYDSQFSDIWIGQCGAAGVRMDSGAQFFSNLHVWECVDGVQVRSDANRFVNVYLETNTGDGIDFLNCSHTSVLGGVLRANTTHGCVIGGTSTRNRIVGLAAYNNGSNGIQVSGDYNQIIGNNCFDTQGTKTQDRGIYIASGTGNVVAGNVSRDGDHTTEGITDAGTQTDNRDKVTLPKTIAYCPTLAYKSPNSTPAAFTANTAHFIPFELDRPTPIDTVVFEVGTSSGNVDVGIYDNTGTSGAPGARLASSGSTACPATGGQGIAVAPGVLPPGRYYAALVPDNATATFRYSGVSLVANGMGQAGYTQASAFPLPATAGATVSTAANQFHILAAIT